MFKKNNHVGNSAPFEDNHVGNSAPFEDNHVGNSAPFEDKMKNKHIWICLFFRFCNIIDVNLI
ncbi:hypothetical protein [Capnocytophaga cynodegmi]|uniref:hypothetical protein n=1 Tax=Capnocytophaga cynodegmi TaxID=28189 RepID=UPI001BB3FE50|nr:hypothetical protein [Capnocytophaga cynodegmi]